MINEKELIKYINKLKEQSFEGWQPDAINGYMTAIKSIEVKINELLNTQ